MHSQFYTKINPSNQKEEIFHLKKYICSRPDMVAVGACLFGFFIFYVNFVVLETIGVPLCQQQLGEERLFNLAKDDRSDQCCEQAGLRVSLFKHWAS